MRTEITLKFAEKKKELSEVKERLKVVEDFLVERKEKAELKRTLRESAGIGVVALEAVEGESSQPTKRRRLVKLAEKQKSAAEEELEALHEKAFMADLEARRMFEDEYS